jgi:LSD1 subclass zinc finger protein
MSFARMFSRKVAARRGRTIGFCENRRLHEVLSGFARSQNRKNYAYFRCPGCRSWLKLPRGAGKVTITCLKCGRQTNKTA